MNPRESKLTIKESNQIIDSFPDSDDYFLHKLSEMTDGIQCQRKPSNEKKKKKKKMRIEEDVQMIHRSTRL